VKLSKGPFKPFGLKVTLDGCAIAAGGRHPIIKTFMGPGIYDQFENILHTCPYGVGLKFLEHILLLFLNVYFSIF
jgi:hypothetical protein